jgi:hypothetical protein
LTVHNTLEVFAFDLLADLDPAVIEAPFIARMTT